MDKKRRATPSDFPSTRPWPVVQRRKIEKLKEARMSEFERLCNDSFEWLENYYQGCVYAANQNRPQTEAEQLNLSTYR
ncbi:hypothetical protein BGZ54_000214 [Gamsiella multidivaricata]|nr:hypothetical protein BGZ54_000214 [Gamsiella multidivaricata]